MDRMRAETREVCAKYSVQIATGEGERAGLRPFNNCIKAQLIETSVRASPGARAGRRTAALDMCGGCGGDLPKYGSCGVAEVVIADGSAETVAEARQRHAAMEKTAAARGAAVPPALKTIVADCTIPGLAQMPEIGEGTRDVVACQFALHYAFCSRDALDGILSNAADALCDGGWFIGTMVDANAVVRRALAADAADGGARRRAGGPVSFGNSLYGIAFRGSPQRAAQKTLQFTTFGDGAKYEFTLNRRIDAVPEWLAHFETLRSRAGLAGLDVVEDMTMPFLDFYESRVSPEIAAAFGLAHPRAWRSDAPGRAAPDDCRGRAAAPGRGRVRQTETMLTDDEREVAELYATFAFARSARTRGVKRPGAEAE